MTDAVVLRFSETQLDAGAEALRQHEQGGRLLRKWSDLPNSDKKKWRNKVMVVMAAVIGDPPGA